MILIYSKQKDEFVNDVIDCLMNYSFFRISQGNGFVYVESVFKAHSENHSLIKNKFSEEIDIQKITSIWFNGGAIDLNDSYKNNSSELNQLLFQNLNIIIDGVLEAKKIKKIGNTKNNKKTNKIYNLLAAKNVGLQIPETLITTSKEKLLRFIKTHNKFQFICKRINESSNFIEKKYLFDNSKTFLLTKNELEKLPDNFGLSFFQQRIKKKFEIRSIYFDNKFYSSAIFDNQDNVDYRVSLQNLDNKPRIVPYVLPKKIKKKLKSLLQILNYTYCSIDLLYTNDGRYVFLEINPCGQVGYINSACNYYLEEEISKYLKNESK
ncbi:conserved hypothetical protein [Tenacibaculum xiamenense]